MILIFTIFILINEIYLCNCQTKKPSTSSTPPPPTQCGCDEKAFQEKIKKNLAKHKLDWNNADEFNKPLWEEDMEIPPEQLNFLYNPQRASGRNAMELDDLLWTDRVVNVYIDTNFTKRQKKKIVAAYKELFNKTNNCLSLVFVSSLDLLSNYIHVTNLKPRCSSSVGMQSKKQYINYGKPYCFEKGRLQHEMMHALGFYHEHTRPDRDEYIFVDYTNVLSNKCKKYYRCLKCRTFDMPYDYRSIMHYAAFNSENVCNETRNIMKSITATEIDYQRVGLTDLDAQKIMKLYNCSAVK